MQAVVLIGGKGGEAGYNLPRVAEEFCLSHGTSLIANDIQN